MDIKQQYYSRTAASINTLTLRILKNRNLCKEIVFDSAFYAPYIPKFMTNPKYKFSRAKWYVADFDWVHQAEVSKWCTQHFGPHPLRPDAWSRWFNKYNEKIHFRDEKDYAWFMLRWS